MRWKPPETRNWPLGQRAVTVLVCPVLTQTVLWGVGVAGITPRPQTVCTVTVRAVVVCAGLGSSTTTLMW